MDITNTSFFLFLKRYLTQKQSVGFESTGRVGDSSFFLSSELLLIAEIQHLEL